MNKVQAEKIKELAEEYGMASRIVQDAEHELIKAKDRRTAAWSKLATYLEVEVTATQLTTDVQEVKF